MSILAVVARAWGHGARSSCTVCFCSSSFVGSLILCTASRDTFLCIPTGVLPKRHASWDKEVFNIFIEVFNIFIVVYSINSFFKKYRISWVQLSSKLSWCYSFKSGIFFHAWQSNTVIVIWISSVLIYSYANKTAKTLAVPYFLLK